MINDRTEQRSIGWYRARIGCVTGSRCADLMGKGRGKDAEWSQTALTYLYELAGERMFDPDFLDDDDVLQDYIDSTAHVSKAMQWGIEQEDAAKNAFLEAYFPDGQGEMAEVSSCKHDTIEWFAASPDGILLDRRTGEQCVMEVKCPTIAVYMKYRSGIKDAGTLKAVEPKYYWQVMAEMSCTGTGTAYFIAYNPWLTDTLHVVRIERDEDAIAALEDRVRRANAVIKGIIDNL